MRIVEIKFEKKPFNLISENKVIEANITTSHPEYTLEDNSMIIFDSADVYYEFIKDTNLYSEEEQSVNIEDIVCSSKLLADSVDDVIYKDAYITSIYDIPFNGHDIYYIQRSGINNLLEE